MAKKREVEVAEYAAMVRRVVAGYGRRLADSDPTDLVDALAIARQLDSAIAEAVRGMRETHGYSWADVAAVTGTTRQAAQQRWGKAA